MEQTASFRAAASLEEATRPPGSQTLLRGLDVHRRCGQAPCRSAELSEAAGAHAQHHPPAGLGAGGPPLPAVPARARATPWGPSCWSWGARASQQMNTSAHCARPSWKPSSAATEDTVHLGAHWTSATRSTWTRSPGRRRSRDRFSRRASGTRSTSTGLGKALILDKERGETGIEMFYSPKPARRSTEANLHRSGWSACAWLCATGPRLRP